MEDEDGKPGDAGNADINSVMGFSGFGGNKKAKQFDFMSMFEQTRRIAVERSKKTLAERADISDKDVVSEHTKNRTTGSDPTVGPPAPESVEQTGDSDDEMVGPPLPPATGGVEDSDEDEEGEETGVGGQLEDRIPSSHEIELQQGTLTVSGLAMDPSGARLIAGGYDYNLRFWDFAGMDSSLKSFRQTTPCDGFVIKSVQYSITGERILVVSGNAQAKLLDRDGFDIMECKKGDQYIMDMSNTKGHTGMLNSGCWHPKNKTEFMTCSIDGSVRLWDVNEEEKHKSIMKPRTVQGRRTVPTTCTYSTDGNYVAVACQDGSIQIWDHRKKFFVNTAMINRTAHTKGSDTSCLSFSYDTRTLASRGGDDTLKLWDIRSFKKPLCVAENLYNRFPMTDCQFSPDDKMVITGLSVGKDETGGKLVFLDRLTLDTLTEIEASPTSVVRSLWHPRLNQIVVGTGNGVVKVLYDPNKSHRGAKLCVVKTKRKTKQIEFTSGDYVITPHALPLFREDRQQSTRKQNLKARKDPVKSRRPDLPITGVGVGGRVGHHGSTLSQYVAKQIAVRKPDERDKDPRAAILRHAKEAAENPYWVSPAYQSTQPKAIFQKDEKDHSSENEPTGTGVVPANKKQKTT